jgi:hypothetical protein
MISMAPTVLQPTGRTDGGILDLDPARRERRLAEAGVSIERRGVLRYVVRQDGRQVGLERRTFDGAQRFAHRLAA